MGVEHLAVVHAVQLIARQDEDMFDARLLDVADVFANGVGGAFVPVGAFEGLLCGEDFDESPMEGIEVVGVADVTMQADRVELGQQIDPVQTAVEAVRNGDVNQPVFARQGNGGLRAMLGERIESRAFASTEDQRHHVPHY